MISLIICSRSGMLSEELRANIDETIGVPYEIISIDNSGSNYNIFEAYNIGVERSTFSALCFMHEDILYKSTNWGNAVLNHFKDEEIGAIGIAGTPYQSFLPGAWWASGLIYEHIVQSDNVDTAGSLKSSGCSEIKQVVAIDGVWICIRKNLFSRIKFDNIHYRSFHYYDLDICMQMYQHGIKMFCVSNILIHHFSMGDLSPEWIASTLRFKSKWRNKLPAKCIHLSYNEQFTKEFKTLNEFIWICKQNLMESGEVYSIAISSLLRFYQAYFFYKTPGYLLKYLINLFKSSSFQNQKL